MLKVEPVRAFEDNYIWVLRDGPVAAVVDPGDGEPVLEFLDREGLSLSAILATHHHGDHVGGNEELLARWRVPVFGPRDPRIDTVTHPVGEGDEIEVPRLGLRMRVLEIPGHTRTHIGYYGSPGLFCGDTLFACGCGRLFEGTPQQMVQSLDKLAALPDETLVYCAHEYTLSNIRFALAVEPGNAALHERAGHERATRERDAPTLPSRIGLEKATNPFLRCTAPEVVAAARRHDPAAAERVAVFAAIREWKNRF